MNNDNEVAAAETASAAEAPAAAVVVKSKPTRFVKVLVGIAALGTAGAAAVVAVMIAAIACMSAASAGDTARTAVAVAKKTEILVASNEAVTRSAMVELTSRVESLESGLNKAANELAAISEKEKVAEATRTAAAAAAPKGLLAYFRK
jgi:hypothetical protein